MLYCLIFSLFFFQLAIPGELTAREKKVTVINMTTPFGSEQYIAGSAFEQVFKKADSWVEWQPKETPGAIYMIKYFAKNRKALTAGTMPPIVISTSTGVQGHINEARPPFTPFKNMNQRAIFSTWTFLYVFTTFDSDLTDLKDLAGKKVGINEKPRMFTGTLVHRPYFKKGLGIWNKVNWQMIGVINSKDALLNGQIDAASSNFIGSVEVQSDGTMVCNKVAPTTALLELMNSGRKLRLIGMNPDTVKRSFDYSKDMRVFPILIKKGAHESIKKDIWVYGTTGIYVAHKSMPDDVVQEIIRVRYQYRKDLAKYHSAMGFYSENPYPVGAPEKWVHPGVKKAMKALNIPMP